jgi:hypothetical protein
VESRWQFLRLAVHATEHLAVAAARVERLLVVRKRKRKIAASAKRKGPGHVTRSLCEVVGPE